MLAERLARRFGREMGYSVLPYDGALHAQVVGDARSRLGLLIGCVDNGAARRCIGYGAHPRPDPSTRPATGLSGGDG